MAVKYSCIFAFVLTAISLVCGQQVKSDTNSGAAKQAAKTDVRIENLKKQATEVYEALNKTGDFEKLANTAHPKLIEIAGGREKYIEMMTKALQMTNELFESLSWTIGDPDSLVEIDGQIIGVVPRTIIGITFQKDKNVQEGAIVGISVDNGKTWKFVNGPNFKSLFPSFADKVQIPEQMHFVNGIKQ